MEKYAETEIEVVFFDSVDVITMSTTDVDPTLPEVPINND